MCIKYGTSLAKVVQLNNIYIYVEKTYGNEQDPVHRSGLSGRYQYHCTEDNADIFRADRPGIFIPRRVGLTGENLFLIYRNGFWFITNEHNVHKEIDNKFGAFLQVQTTGF